MNNEPVILDNFRDKANAFRTLGASLPKVTLDKANDVGLATVDLPVKHYFSNGVYARELFIPKGCALLGHIHKYQNLNILLKGKIAVAIDEKITEIEAPYVLVSPAGVQRIAYAIEDCLWLTVHGTIETDLNDIEHTFIAKSEQEYLDFISQQLKLPLGQ